MLLWKHQTHYKIKIGLPVSLRPFIWQQCSLQGFIRTLYSRFKGTPYISDNGIICSKDVAIKMDLPLYGILNEQINM